MAVVLAMVVAPLVPAVPSSAATSTVVSLTFDDGHWSHYSNAHPRLAARGMQGTFYVNSGLTPETCPSWCWRMTWGQARAMHDAGQEIGGHTLDHVDLTTVTETEARRQVCADRQMILDRGFTGASFAYPYSGYNATAKKVVEGCGYTSGRTVGNFTSAVYAETIPPVDAFALRTPVTDNKLASLQAAVTRAENNGGGWVIMNFHEVCDCSDAPSSVTPATFSAFLDWLQPRAAAGTHVRTVAQAMGSSSSPPPPPPPPPPADTTSPTVAITAPRDGATVGGTVQVTASASDVDSGVKQVEFWRGTTLLGTDTTAPYSVSWNTRKVAKTLHTLTATATDVAGNAASHSIDVTVVK